MHQIVLGLHLSQWDKIIIKALIDAANKSPDKAEDSLRRIHAIVVSRIGGK